MLCSERILAAAADDDEDDEYSKGEDSKCGVTLVDTVFQITVTQMMSCHQNVVN